MSRSLTPVSITSQCSVPCARFCAHNCQSVTTSDSYLSSSQSVLTAGAHSLAFGLRAPCCTYRLWVVALVQYATYCPDSRLRARASSVQSRLCMTRTTFCNLWAVRMRRSAGPSALRCSLWRYSPRSALERRFRATFATDRPSLRWGIRRPRCDGRPIAAVSMPWQVLSYLYRTIIITKNKLK